MVEILPSSLRLLSVDGMVSKEFTLKSDDYELLIEDRWVGQLPLDVPAPYVAMYRTDQRPLDARDNIFENSSYTGVALNVYLLISKSRISNPSF